MAYGRKRTTGRKSYSSSRRAPARRAAPKRRATRAAPRQQVIKLMIETAPSSPVSRPDMAGSYVVQKPKGKAKL